MNPWKKIIRACCLAAAFIWSAPYLFLSLFGKVLAVDQLEVLVGRKVTVERFVVSPWLRMDMEKVVIAGSGSIEKISIEPSYISFLTAQVVFRGIRITRPNIQSVHANILSAEKKPRPAAGRAAAIFSPASSSGEFYIPASFPVVVRRFEVIDGTYRFIDKTRGDEEGVDLVISGINLTMDDLTAVYPAVTKFHLRGSVPWLHARQSGEIQADGWINFFKNDIDAKLVISHIDAESLQPYYREAIDLQKARIDKATLSFTGTAKGTNNMVNVKCRLELTDIIRSERDDTDQPKERDERLADTVLGTFETLKEQKALEFGYTTRLDKPEFAFGIVESAFKKKLTRVRGELRPGDIILFPGKLVLGVMQGVVDISKAMVDGGFSVGNEVKKSLSGPSEKQ